MPEVIKKWASSQFSIQCLSDLSISSQFPKLPPVALQPAGQQCGHQSRSHTRSEIVTLRKEQQLQRQQPPPMEVKHLSLEQQIRNLRDVQKKVDLDVEEEEEEEEEEQQAEESQSESEPQNEEQQHYEQQMQVQRKHLQVRKVRSEIKYVENNPKEAAKKNRESKSDHEFANERDVSSIHNIN